MNTATTVDICGHSYFLRASNYAAQVYAEHFAGFTDTEGFDGNLAHDGALLYSKCVTVDESGEGRVSVSGFVPHRFWGILWALAYAGGSTTLGYQRWYETEVRDEVATVSEQAVALGEVVDLLMTTFFREREKRAG